MVKSTSSQTIFLLNFEIEKKSCNSCVTCIFKVLRKNFFLPYGGSDMEKFSVKKKFFRKPSCTTNKHCGLARNPEKEQIKAKKSNTWRVSAVGLIFLAFICSFSGFRARTTLLQLSQCTIDVRCFSCIRWYAPLYSTYI